MVLSNVERDESPNHRKKIGGFQLLSDWSADLAIYKKHEKSRMKEASDEFSSLVSSLKLRSEKMPIEEYVQLAG